MVRRRSAAASSAASPIPALAVYRAELFPTGNRGRAAGLLTAAALLGGIVGILLVGAAARRRRRPYGGVMALLALGQVVVVTMVLASYPETAHQELEALNPEDAASPIRQPLRQTDARRSERRVDGAGDRARRQPFRSWPLPSIQTW